MHSARNRLSYPNVMSTIAVFIALGGATAFAATALPKNSVGSRQLKKNAVTAAKIEAGAVGGNRLADGAVSSNQLANGAVTGAKIANLPARQPDLQAGSRRRRPLRRFDHRALPRDLQIAANL